MTPSFSFRSWFGFIAIGLLREQKGEGRDAPATMGCLLLVGMSVPAHPQPYGELLLVRGNRGWLRPPTPEEGCSRLEGVGWVTGGFGGMDDDEADTGTGGGEAEGVLLAWGEFIEWFEAGYDDDLAFDSFAGACGDIGELVVRALGIEHHVGVVDFGVDFERNMAGRGPDDDNVCGGVAFGLQALRDPCSDRFSERFLSGDHFHVRASWTEGFGSGKGKSYGTVSGQGFKVGKDFAGAAHVRLEAEVGASVSHPFAKVRGFEMGVGEGLHLIAIIGGRDGICVRVVEQRLVEGPPAIRHVGAHRSVGVVLCLVHDQGIVAGFQFVGCKQVLDGFWQPFLVVCCQFVLVLRGFLIGVGCSELFGKEGFPVQDFELPFLFVGQFLTLEQALGEKLKVTLQWLVVAEHQYLAR